MAKKYGVNAAIMIRHFQFWIIKNRADKRHRHDGHTWTYSSVIALAKIFPYWSIRQIRVILDKLLDESVLIKGSYNIKGRDRTKWYAFADEKAFVRIDKTICQNGQIHLSKMTNTFVKNDKCIIGTDTSPYPKPTDESPDKQQLGISSEKTLDLDLQIANARNFFCEQIERIFHLTTREKKTFTNIAKYLVQQCQEGKLQPAIFKDAVEWARIAKASNATNKKGLFVAKLKEQTGYKSTKKLLKEAV